MAKSAVNYTGLIPETSDSFESATQNTTGSLEGIDNKLGVLNANKLERGPYTGNAQQLKTEIDDKLPKGGYTGTASDLNIAIQNIGDGSPKGTYATLVALQTAFPTGTTGTYVVTADGNWYYWNGTAWTSGGVYQATAISDKSITLNKLRNKPTELFLWNGYEKYDTGSGYAITFKSQIVFQSITGNFLFFQNLGEYSINLQEGYKIILNWDEDTTVIATNFTDFIQKVPVNTNFVDQENMLFSYIGNNLYEFSKNVKNLESDLYCWGNIEENKTSETTTEIILKGNVVFQEEKNGNFVYYNGLGDYTASLSDGKKLILRNNFNLPQVQKTDFSNFYIVDVSYKNNIFDKTIATNISGNIEYFIKFKEYENYDVYSIKKNLMDVAPEFYKKINNLTEDINLVHIGDSISTNNYYTKPRTDAMYRPPMMTEYCYASHIEELLRPQGQEYRRYDTGFISEVGYDTVETKEYDEWWDWVNTSSNYRPSLTRVLTGNSCKIYYTIPKKACRCDYIYRTDSQNADTCTVLVGSNNKVSVFDDTTQSWVEANGYVFSAKESDARIEGQPSGLPFRKSFNQKRLKMKVNRTNNDGNIVVQILNNGVGRLTYWGVQFSHREYMFNYLLQARGGHSISKLRNFEEWDIDYFKPQLILQQCCVLNEADSIALTDGTPKDLLTNTPTNLSNRFLAYSTDLKNKSYNPELIIFGLFFATGSNAINPDTDEIWYGYSGEDKISYMDYFKKLAYTYKQNNFNYFDVFNKMNKCFQDKSKKENKTLVKSSLEGSGIYGKTFTIDGGHLNTNGSKLVFDILKNIFV